MISASEQGKCCGLAVPPVLRGNAKALDSNALQYAFNNALRNADPI